MLRWLVCLIVVVCIWLFGVVVAVRFASCLLFGLLRFSVFVVL